ncbi:DUF397 domain-containing protein [Actinomadura graeca]|uniref:DUF397 domain-containing protein n=1 Tax=Actinomadura graeca TaxID=2750812 RepID=A0ABX8R057_9ACTN|nr:DUF397 domain-containing protein [Actinomadura graeca]QXJ24395.1 DUF397 domain-containing protein [Actinomadura graeca]
MIRMNLSSANWRKSSRSTDTGGQCIEVADVSWIRSSHSGDTGGECIEVADLTWVKSSHSTDTGGDCVEVARVDPAVAVRDSKDPDGPKLVLDAGEWRAFLSEVKRAL